MASQKQSSSPDADVMEGVESYQQHSTHELQNRPIENTDSDDASESSTSVHSNSDYEYDEARPEAPDTISMIAWAT